MIPIGKSPHVLMLWGLLALTALALLLSPLVPAGAQTPAIQKEIENELERLRHMKAELEKARQQLEKQQAELEKKAQELRHAMERFTQGQVKDPASPRPPQGPWPPLKPGGFPMAPLGKGPGFGKVPDLERRLQELERKLEGLLHEIHEVRRDMANIRPGFGSFGPPGEKPFPARKGEPREKGSWQRSPEENTQPRPGLFPPPIPREAPGQNPRAPGSQRNID